MNIIYTIPQVLTTDPDAISTLRGSPEFPSILGRVSFWQLPNGVLVSASVTGLPVFSEDMCADPVFALHIHNGSTCTGNEIDPFADVGEHYNPYNCPHPYHGGDLMNIFANYDFGWSAMLTNRFQLDGIIGRTTILHLPPEDYVIYDPNAGDKIACGVIVKVV